MKETAQEIVKRSGSNLAFALAVLPTDRRRDMGIFYAFCRVVDDIADDPGIPVEQRREQLQHWRELIDGATSPADGIESEFRDLQQRYSLDPEVLKEIIAGVEMDLEPLRFDTREDLQKYCYRVASAVGLISIEVFGYQNPQCRDYAVELGYALQWTNIIRDVGEDAREGRIYIPSQSLANAGISDDEILSAEPDLNSFRQMMKAECEVARAHYAKAESLLPAEDRASMRSAEMMKRIYRGILDKIEADQYRVFEKRYRLSKVRMLGEFLRAKWS